ncbi:MAG: ABC transporter permease [Gammaproteobacteria bacterium]|nr:ABC transporter permease [Gammaproteobacteria bacterium]
MNTQINKSNYDAKAVYWLESRAELLKTFRDMGFTIPSLIFPAMFYIFFGLVFNKSAMSGQMPSYLLATYGVFGVIGPALFSFGVGVASERQQGWLTLKQCTPMPISAYFFARVVTAQVFGLIIVFSLFILGAVFGNVELTRTQWILTLLCLVIGSLPFCAMGLWLGLTLSAKAAPATVNLIYLPMAFLSGLWIPIQLFPEFMQSLAWIFPAFHLSQLTLAIQGFHLKFDLIWHLSILVLMTVVFFFLAFRAFKKMSIN